MTLAHESSLQSTAYYDRFVHDPYDIPRREISRVFTIS